MMKKIMAHAASAILLVIGVAIITLIVGMGMGGITSYYTMM